jgi:hypothetical protein
MRLVRRLTLIAVALIVAVFAAGFLAGRATAHDRYHQWFGADGGPCCSDLGRECRPVRSYFDEEAGHYLILQAGRWVPVPARAVRAYSSPDGSSHACIGSSGTIFCFVNGVPRS